MKNIFILAIICLTGPLTAQVNWDSVMETKSARQFLATIYENGNDMNICVDINGSAHQLISGAIVKEAHGIVDYILQNGNPDLSLICNDMTILQYGIQYGDADLVKQLLSAGADPNQTSESGQSAYDLAIQLDKPVIVGYLKSLTK